MPFIQYIRALLVWVHEMYAKLWYHSRRHSCSPCFEFHLEFLAFTRNGNSRNRFLIRNLKYELLRNIHFEYEQTNTNTRNRKTGKKGIHTKILIVEDKIRWKEREVNEEKQLHKCWEQNKAAEKTLLQISEPKIRINKLFPPHAN